MWVAVGLAGSLAGAAPLRAADAPAFVIPGKAGVPVIINGVDASYTVVEGDWGLDRPGYVPPTIVTPPLFGPAPSYYGGYFPARGRQPGYGRYEVEPPPTRRLPRPAPSFHREWSAQSERVPADGAHAQEQERDPPQINIEANVERRAPPVRRRQQ